MYPIAHICFALILLDVFSRKERIDISSMNKILVAFLSILPDIDYVIDWIYGTHFHWFQFIPITISLIILSILYFKTEKYKKGIFLCLIAVGSQFFGDLLVGSQTYLILAFTLHVIPGNFMLFMLSFEIIMPIILLIFKLITKNATMSADKEMM